MGAVGAVFGSWMNDRAIVYRRKYNIPSEWGTAVNVQAMVYGNTGRRLRVRRRVHAESGQRRQGVLRRVPDQRAGRRRGCRRAHAGAGRRAEEADAQGVPGTGAHPADARAALQGRAGLRVHHRGRRRLHAADAQRQAHGDGGAQVLDGHAEGEADRLEDRGHAQSGRPARAVARAGVRHRRGREGEGDCDRVCLPARVRPRARSI